MLFCVLIKFTEHSYSNWLFDLFSVVFFHESCDFTCSSLGCDVTWEAVTYQKSYPTEAFRHMMCAPAFLERQAKMGDSCFRCWNVTLVSRKKQYDYPKKGQSIHKLRQKALIHFIWQNRMRNNSKNYSDTEIRRWQRKDDILCQSASPHLRKSTGRHWRLNSDVSEPTNLIAPRKLQDIVSQ